MDTFEGTVVHGDGYARTIGFPTANLEDISGKLPKKGLYIAHTEYENKNYFGGLCINEKIELFLVDFEGNLYGARLKINTIKKIKNVEDIDRNFHKEDLEYGLKLIEEIKASF